MPQAAVSPTTPSASSAGAASLAALVLDRIAATPGGEAYRWVEGTSWRSMTWAEAGGRVRAIACGLRAVGLAAEERAAIIAGTRYEWVLADLGIMCAAGATTTVYPSSTPDDTAYILSDSRSVVAFAENETQVQKLVAKRGELPALKKVIVFDGAGGHGGWVITLAELEELGRQADAKEPSKFEAVARAIQPSALATLIYTSGTTGRPKGVELTHDCWVYEGEAIEALGILRREDVQYLWLPLAHSFGKVLESAQLRIGFPTAIDGRIEKIVENLGVVQPTFVAAVPRIFEKVHNKVVSGAAEGGKAKLRIFRWAMRVGREVSARRQAGRWVPPWLALAHKIADKLVFSKLRAKFGGKLRYFISGSAPLNREIAEFFHAAGIVILEGYGLTETSAATFVNRPDKYRFGTVGLPVLGTEVKIAPEDGEILIRGRGVMRGYHGLAEATRETIDADGWLHTGDIGVIHPEGFLQITDRKKDLIKTSGGKYVAPQNLEGQLKAICPYVSQAVVHGNNRNFCSALVTVDEESIKKWAAEQGLPGGSYAELAARPEVKALVQTYIDRLNSSLASYESIKKFAILPADLSQEGGELTPSLKVKRKAVEEKYKKILDGFYADAMAKA